MHKITVWNKRSTNFDANAFVRVNGTNQIEIESENRALRLMGHLIHNPQIDKAILTTPKGRISWAQHRKDESPKCGECPGNNCDGCPYDEVDNTDLDNDYNHSGYPYNNDDDI